MNEKIIINIGRQLGSGGKEVGEKLATRMGIAFYDKELINLASKESGLCEELFEKADETPSRTALGGLFSARFSLFTDASPFTNYLSNDTLFKIQSDVIRELAAEKSCLFVGRCADYILRDNARCVNIFITAPLAQRTARVSASQNVSNTEAEEIISRVDKKRAEYYNYYSYKTWGMASTYHLCIDSSVLGIDGTVNYIETFVKQKLGLHTA